MPQPKELQTGWLSPTGEFYETALYGHLSKARELLTVYNAGESHRPDDELLALGWVSITLSDFGATEWRIAWRRPLTPEQKTFLEPYFHDYYAVEEYSKTHWEEECE